MIDAHGCTWAHEQLITRYLWPLFARNDFWLRAAVIRVISFIITYVTVEEWIQVVDLMTNNIINVVL